MEGFLEKNLKLIERYNPKLCAKVRNVDISSCNFELVTNLVGEYNIQIDGRPVHSVTGAQAEAQELFDSSVKETMNIVHVFYGLGLGYLFDTFCENATGIKLLYEPDITLLRYVFDLVDFSQNLSKTDVFVVSDNAEFAQIYSSVFRYKFATEIYTLDFYKSFHAEKLAVFKSFVNSLYEQNFYNHQYLCSHLDKNLESMFKKLAQKVRLPLLSSSENRYKGKTAVIASAGPSLYENIEDLKKYRNNVCIISVGTALRVMVDNGITPDYVCYTEKYYAASQFDGIDTSTMSFILEPSSAVELFSLPSKNKFLTLSYENNVNHLFAQIIGIDLPYFEVKGTVAYQALSSAKLLGFESIILLGQDLAYTNGNCYSKGSVYEHLECIKTGDSYRLAPKDPDLYKKAFFNGNENISDEEKEKQLNEAVNKLNQSIDFVKGVDGNILPTSVDYKRFIGYFEFFANQNFSSKLYNASFGAQINGFENKHLSQLFKDTSLNNQNNENFVQVDNNSSEVNRKTKKAAEQLRFYKNSLKSAADFIKIILTKDCEEYTLDEIYKKFEQFNTMRSQNHLLRLITYTDYTYRAWHFREYSNSPYTKSLLNVRNYLYKFFTDITEKIESMTVRLDEIAGEINESCTTKS